MPILLAVALSCAACDAMNGPTAPERPCRVLRLATLDSFPVVATATADTTWSPYIRRERCVQ